MSVYQHSGITLLAVAIGCGAGTDGRENTAETSSETGSETAGLDTSSSTLDDAATSTERDATSSGTLGTSSGSTGEAWPECVGEAGADVAVEITLNPGQPDDEWHRYAGACIVASLDAATSVVTAELECSGDEGPAPNWGVTLTVEGLTGEPPSDLVEGASFEVVVVVQRFNADLTAFAITSSGGLVMAGASGNHPDVEAGMGNPPQALWAPLAVSPASAQICPTQPGIDCPLTVARNAVVFSGLDEPDVELFDHSSFVGTNYAYGLGRALAFVDDESGDVCEGSQPTWYDFVVSRVASR